MYLERFPISFTPTAPFDFRFGFANAPLSVRSGGTAVVIEGQLLPEGAVTNLAVGAHLREDGIASGYSNCDIPSVVVISGDITQGEENADGSVTFSRSATVVDLEHARSFELRAVMSLSRLWQRQGKRAAARQALTEIYHSFSEGVDTADVREAEVLLHAMT